MKTIFARPSFTINGFKADKLYSFSVANERETLYETIDDCGHSRIENADTLKQGKPSAHLWDAVNWPGGHWIINT